MQNAAWSRMVSVDRLHISYLGNCVTTHSTLDNKDGRQETLAGSGTTHAPTRQFLKFYLQERSKIYILLKDELSIWSTEPLPYNIEKRNGPDLFPKFQMQFDIDETELALKRDIAWSLCGVNE